ncbi:hypothetical protein [Campylobacter pinnipediorum]|uniref:hypothetical protein n=1 Tax=Campylobacter pinnipediorum TaxID=1965231 RepID=UPI000994D8A7|nr:hypothetical protein [Campylobacter pinnipediorum]AQW82996.1 hypothetical protein CPIN17261_0992 [Campylobacter pinnipediorum subsp. pinnipediorum]
MAWVSIPQGARQIQINGQWLDIPKGAREYEVPDDYMQKINQPQQQTQPISIPKAPQTDNAPTQNRSWFDNFTHGASDFIDDISAPVKQAYQGVSDLVDKAKHGVENLADDTFQVLTGSSDERMREVKNKMKQNSDISKLTKTVASQQALNSGTFALNELFKSADEKHQDIIKTKNIFSNMAKQMGYKPVFGKDKDGGLRFGVMIGDNDVKDITPDFFDALGASSKELLGSTIGGITALATKNPTAGATASALVGGMLGGGFGSMSDYATNSANTGNDTNIAGYANSFTGGFGNEAIGVGMASLFQPVLKAAVKGTEKTIKIGGKVINMIPIINAIRKQNVDGAFKEFEKQMGGKEATQEILRQADEFGSRVNIEDGSTLVNTAKQTLDDGLENFNKFESNNETINRAKELANEYAPTAKNIINKAQNIILDNDKITKAQSDFLTGARANERVAQMAQATLSSNADAANNMTNVITKDANKIVSEFENLRGNPQSIRDISDEYVKQTKKDFGEGLDALGTAYRDVKVAIPDDEAGKDFLNGVQALKDSVWGGVPSTKIKNITEKLHLREIDIKGVNDLRAELNHIISTTNDNNLKYIANNVKHYLENDVLDDILSKLPISKDAKKLYQSMVKEYRDMARIQDADWYKKTLDNDLNDDSINKAVSKVFEENAKDNSVKLFLSKLPKEKAKDVELNIIHKSLTQTMSDFGNKGKVVDVKKLAEVLNKQGFKSPEAKSFINLINRAEKLIGQDVELAKAIGNFKKQNMPGQGIGNSVVGRFDVMLTNRTVKNLVRFLPIIGRQPALLHHIEQAMMKAKGYVGFLENIKVIANNPKTPQNIRTSLNAFYKVLANGDNPIGNGFTTQRNNGIEHRFTTNVNKSVRDNAGISDKQVVYDANKLGNKHPEMFKGGKSKANNAAKLIHKVKDNPTFFFSGSNPSTSLIAKRVGDKVGEIAIQKDGELVNAIVHAIKSSREDELSRLVRREEKQGNKKLPVKK